MNRTLRTWSAAAAAFLAFCLLPHSVRGQPAQPPERPAPGEDAAELPEAIDFPGADLFNDQPRFLAGVAANHASGVYQEGDKLAVRFVAEREAHLYLLYHQADGASLLLFPNAVRRDNRTLAKEPLDVPKAGEGLRFRIQPPFGIEVLQVLATLQPAPELDALVGPGNEGETRGRPPLVSAETLAGLRDRLRQDLASWTEHRVRIRTQAKGAPSPRQAARVGLFVGIGKYLHPEFCATHDELRHSAEVMRDVMLRRGGLDPQRTRLVTDEQATKANLQALITRWLPGMSQPGDTVFIYFSSHSGQFETRDPSEPDGQDESLAPYDLNAGAENLPLARRQAIYRESSILDDTLGRWLEELQGRQVVLILDGCHNGGLVAGKGIRGKGLQGNEAPEQGVPLFALDGEVQRMKDINQLNTVVLSSCAADEESLATGTPDGTMWFTYFLAQAIEKLPRPLTVQAAHGYVRKGIQELRKQRREANVQEPQLFDSALLPVVLAP